MKNIFSTMKQALIFLDLDIKREDLINQALKNSYLYSVHLTEEEKEVELLNIVNSIRIAITTTNEVTKIGKRTLKLTNHKIIHLIDDDLSDENRLELYEGIIEECLLSYKFKALTYELDLTNSITSTLLTNAITNISFFNEYQFAHARTKIVRLYDVIQQILILNDIIGFIPIDCNSDHIGYQLLTKNSIDANNHISLQIAIEKYDIDINNFEILNAPITRNNTQHDHYLLSTAILNTQLQTLYHLLIDKSTISERTNNPIMNATQLISYAINDIKVSTHRDFGNVIITNTKGSNLLFPQESSLPSRFIKTNNRYLNCDIFISDLLPTSGYIPFIVGYRGLNDIDCGFMFHPQQLISKLYYETFEDTFQTNIIAQSQFGNQSTHVNDYYKLILIPEN